MLAVRKYCAVALLACACGSEDTSDTSATDSADSSGVGPTTSSGDTSANDVSPGAQDTTADTPASEDTTSASPSDVVSPNTTGQDSTGANPTGSSVDPNATIDPGPVGEPTTGDTTTPEDDTQDTTGNSVQPDDSNTVDPVAPSEDGGAALAPDPGSSTDDSTDVAPIDMPDTTAPLTPATGTPVEEDRAAVPTARGEHGVGALNGEVYVLGGFTPTVTSSVQVYSPEQDAWRDVADFPVVFHHPNVASVDGLLYVLGFHAGSGQRVGNGSVYAYDPTADAWTERTSLPLGTERGASCVTTFEDKIYLFGGTNSVALPDASLYDPATDSWEELPFLPALRHHCIAAEVNGKIYIVSGRDVVIEEVQAESYVFDPVTRKYAEVAPILTPRGGAAGGLLGGLIYVLGGEGNVNDPSGIFHEAEVYDPATDTWAALPDMNVPRHGFGAAVIEDRMYLPGGSTRQGIESQTTHSVFFIDAP